MRVIYVYMCSSCTLVPSIPRLKTLCDISPLSTFKHKSSKCWHIMKRWRALHNTTYRTLWGDTSAFKVESPSSKWRHHINSPRKHKTLMHVRCNEFFHYLYMFLRSRDLPLGLQLSLFHSTRLSNQNVPRHDVHFFDDVTSIFAAMTSRSGSKRERGHVIGRSI